MKAIRYHLAGIASTGSHVALVVTEGRRWVTVIPMDMAQHGPAIRLVRVRHFHDPLDRPDGTTALVGELEELEYRQSQQVTGIIYEWAQRYGATKRAMVALTTPEEGVL